MFYGCQPLKLCHDAIYIWFLYDHFHLNCIPALAGHFGLDETLLKP